MPLTVADVNAYVQFLMNDTGASVYTAAVILPAIKIANDDLQLELLDNGIKYLDEEASEQDIVAGGTVLTTVPSDMVEPIEIHERSTTSTLISDYIRMERHDELPDVPATETLRYWQWREQTVNLHPATAARGIRLRYRKLISALTGDASTIAMMHSKNYFAYRAAGHITAFIEQNPDGASILYDHAERALAKILGISIKGEQGNQPVRRKRFSEKFRRVR